MKNINFGQALEALKQGKTVAREGWNGKGMFLLLVSGESVREAINATYGDEEHPLPVLDAILTISLILSINSARYKNHPLFICFSCSRPSSRGQENGLNVIYQP